jgi:recombinational DNA repair ATPase RecF
VAEEEESEMNRSNMSTAHGGERSARRKVAPHEKLTVRIAVTDVARIDALIAHYVRPWFKPTRSDVLRAVPERRRLHLRLPHEARPHSPAGSPAALLLQVSVR